MTDTTTPHLPSAIEHLPTDDLIPYARNSRTHSPEQVAAVAASIRQFGFTNPVLIDGNNTIIAGHGRVMAAQSLGLPAVPCIRLGHLSDAQRRAYVIADNKLAELAGWDMATLAREVEDLMEAEFDVGLLGFGSDELEELLADHGAGEEAGGGEGEADEDAVPEPPAQPVSALGDVWTMGAHRLMCGDSTSRDSFAVLMAGKSADMIFTDPPYGMSYGGGRAAGDHALDKKTGGVKIKSHGMIMNDDLQGDALVALVRDAIATASGSTKAGGALYACFTWRTYAEFEAALESCGHKVKACIVWDKKSIGLGNSHYRPQHEFVFYCGGEWYGDKSESDVWSMSRGNTGAYVHPTQKPVELVERALANSSKKAAVVIDCFGGSGSTLIACEKTKRHARLMELDPKYCDVIVKRWQTFTGKKATLESTGQTFEEVAGQRLGVEA
jgi:DNA modification methylase